MADRITGIKALHEISLTRKAANGSCTKVLRKNLEGGQAQLIHGPDHPDPGQTEESVMDAKIIKSFAGLQARTGTNGALYVAQLDEEKVKSFFEQDDKAQDAEVAAWVEAEDKKKSEAEAEEKKKAAGDPEVSALRAEVETLKSAATAEKAKARDNELKEKAKSAYPGVPGAYDVLKSIDGLDEAAQKPVLDNLQRQQDMTKHLRDTFGDDAAVEGSAKARYDAVIDEVVKTKSVTKSEAILQVANDPAHAGLIREMRAELAG